MSLVVYDYSSESENEENLENLIKVTSSLKPHRSALKEMFANLPRPKTQTSATKEELDELLEPKNRVNKSQKSKSHIKITISSLSKFRNDSDNEEEPLIKKPKIKLNSSGLFALLPAPKCTPLSNISFVPNVLQKKPNPSILAKSTKILPQYKTNKVMIANKASSGDFDDDTEIPETFDDETWQKVCGKQKRAVQNPAPATYQNYSNVINLAPKVQKPYSGLSNRAFKELVGSRKRHEENIELIDIHEDEIRPEKEEWLKGLTDPNCEPKTTMKDPVNNACRIKNHITSLAQKALANDAELQMRWSENRHNRRQTQAKYGF